MIGPVKEEFEIQDASHIQSATGGTNKNTTFRSKYSRAISSRQGLIIFGIGLVGILAIAGVAVGVSSSSSDNGDDSFVAAPAQREELQREFPARLVKDVHSEEAQPHKTSIEAPSLKKAKILHPKQTKSPKSRAEEVCQTPECLQSATNLINAMDQTADPCVDFYQFACGGWYASHPVTNESLGTFYEADDLIQERLKIILESPADPTDPQPLTDIRTHYATCLDTDTMDSLGLDPLWTQLNVQGGYPMAMDSWDEASFDFEYALARVQKLNVDPFIFVATYADITNTSNKILYFDEGLLGLSSAYLSKPDDYPTEIGYYKTYISDSAKLLRDSIGSSVDDASIDQEVDDLVNFEVALADAMSFIPRNISDIFARTDVAGLQTITDSGTPGQVDWLKFFQAMFEGTSVTITADEPIYLFDEKYFPSFSTLLSTTPKRTLANYLGWWWTKTTGFETTYAMRNVSFNFNHDLNGKSSQKPRSQYCVDQTNDKLGMPLSRAYIDDYFPSEARFETTILVELMRNAFQSLFDENTWMAPEDLIVAKEKLAAITDHVAYPDWIMNDTLFTEAYAGLQINSAEHFNNLMRMSDYFNFWNLETFRDEVTKIFVMPPTVVNAFYDPFANSITILAGILQAPFYTHNSLAALNYGGIGMVIGHEFTHGFDDSGRHFDKDGNLANWWSQETVDAFNVRADCFVEQYDVFSPPELAGTEYENRTVDGKQTLGENIADNGGIREAFRAYSAYVNRFGEEPRLPGLTEYTPNQLFFLGFANVWCEHKTTAGIVNQLDYDPHSPGRFRVIGPLSNDQDFVDTFSCPEGSPMNRGENMCVLW